MAKKSDIREHKKSKYLKFLAYVMCVYFSVALILIAIGFGAVIFPSEPSLILLALGLTLIFITGIMIFGLICAQNLRKGKKWALISLIVLFSLFLAAEIVNLVYSGKTKVFGIIINFIMLALLIIGLIKWDSA